MFGEKCCHSLCDYSKKHWGQDNRIIFTKVCSFSHFSCCLSLSRPPMRSGCCYPTGTMHLHNKSFSVIPACVAPPTTPPAPHSSLLSSSSNLSCCCCCCWWWRWRWGGGLPYIQITMEEWHDLLILISPSYMYGQYQDWITWPQSQLLSHWFCVYHSWSFQTAVHLESDLTVFCC